MTDQYMRNLLRLAIAQICQTIGYNASQVAPLELLQDILHKFIQELCRDLRRQVEHYNRNDANLSDMYLTLRSVNVNISELLDYVNNVEPVPFLHDVPKFPVDRHSDLNFLKPGSKEVLTRPVHIHEHLPPIEPPEPSAQYDKNCTADEHGHGRSVVDNPDLETTAKVEVDQTPDGQDVVEDQLPGFSIPSPYLKGSSINGQFLDDGESTREVRSVVMTTGGFISPAMEGKTPESVIPEIIEQLEGLDGPHSAIAKPQMPPQQPFATVLGVTADNIKKETASPVETKKEKGNAQKGFDKAAVIEKCSEGKSVAVGGMKKSGVNQSGFAASQGPNMVSKILKKAKKKPPMTFPLQQKQASLVDLNGINANDFDLTNKSQRKQFKMLQKLSKSRKYLNTDINPSVLEGMPPGPERQQMEKLLKKQQKQKQKLLKQQMSMAINNRPGASSVENPNLIFSQELPTSEAFSASEQKATTNIQAGGLISSVPDTLPQSNDVSMKSQYFGVKNELGVKVDGSHDPSTHMSNNDGASMQMKLPNEPDRSKLNVLKKISKQKLPDAMPFNQVINLPSGTTITPAPPSDDTALFAPHDARAAENKPIPSMELGQTTNTDGNTNVFEGNRIANPALPLGDKPKKRGRKPGSKNHPKVPGANANAPIKMTKKMKMENKKSKLNTHVAPPPPFGSLSAEPLNLTYPNQMDHLAVQFPNAMASAFNMNDDFQANPEKVRREKKKNKDKNAMITTGGGLPDAVQNAELFNLPTKEEVNSINRKLSRIDTVLKAAPGNSSEYPEPLGEVDVLPSSKLFPPTSKTIGKQKRASNLPASNLTSFVPTSGFPIPMLYPFVPRPGLIPTPGIFPNPILANFGSNSKKTLPNMLLPNCMPFPNLNNVNQGKFPKGASNESLEELSLQSSGLKYCNVPPLVPEANKFGNVLLEKPPTDSAKVSKIQFPASLNDNEGFIKKSIQPHGPDFEAPGSKMSFEVADGLCTSHNPNMTGMFSQGKTIESVAPPISLNPSETIEVSDDSLDSMPKVKAPTNVGSVSVKSEAIMKSAALPSSGLKMNVSALSVSSDVYLHREESEVKKMQRAKKRLNTSVGGVLCKDNGMSSGGVEFIPLPETGVSYSSKTIPPTSLTASGPLQFPVINAKDVAKCTSEITITPNTPGDLDRPHHKDKDHKKMKKLKEGKIKKKKDKKDKMKNKERLEQFVEDTIGKGPDSDKHRDKDIIKKLKKEKKKEKQRMALEGIQNFPAFPVSQATTAFENGGLAATPLQVTSSSSMSSSVPKLTLKLGSCPSPITTNPVDESTPKIRRSPGVHSLIDREKKESSPELAKISPLVTRPMKHKKSTLVDFDAQELDIVKPSKLGTSGVGKTGTTSMNSSLYVPPSPWLPGETLAASCVLLPQQLMQSSKRPDPPQVLGSTVVGSEDQSTLAPAVGGQSPEAVKEDLHGNRVWICPACGKVDDGSAMIGCDGCDAWYHWVCVGIVVAPKDNEDWFCRVCITRRKGTDRKKKRNKKK